MDLLTAYQNLSEPEKLSLFPQLKDLYKQAKKNYTAHNLRERIEADIARKGYSIQISEVPGYRCQTFEYEVNLRTWHEEAESWIESSGDNDNELIDFLLELEPENFGFTLKNLPHNSHDWDWYSENPYTPYECRGYVIFYLIYKEIPIPEGKFIYIYDYEIYKLINRDGKIFYQDKEWEGELNGLILKD